MRSLWLTGNKKVEHSHFKYEGLMEKSCRFCKMVNL